jgi:hypothetical protein
VRQIVDGRRNDRLEPQASKISTIGPLTCGFGAPGRTRTCNLLFRRQLLCPLSYRGLVGAGYRNRQVGRLRTNKPRDCQVWPSMAGAAHHGCGPGGDAAREGDGGEGAGGGGVEEAGVTAQGVVEPAVPEEHAGDAADGELGAGQAVEGDRGGEPGSGAVEVADGHGAVGVAGVEAAADHEGAPDGRPVDPGGHRGRGAQGEGATPRSRPGFQDRGRPLTGSRAAMPSRATAPGPAGRRRSRCSSTAGGRRRPSCCRPGRWRRPCRRARAASSPPGCSTPPRPAGCSPRRRAAPPARQDGGRPSANRTRRPMGRRFPSLTSSGTARL